MRGLTGRGGLALRSGLALRNRLALLGGLALFGAAGAALAQASAPATSPPTWALDPTHTFVHWDVLHMGTSTIRGRFDKSAGNVQFDAKAQQLDLSISIDTGSVNSGVPILDALLKGSAMLDVAANPQAFFVARGARFEGDMPREIRGEFTLRGVSQPLTLRALRWNCGLNPLFRRTVCGGDFEAEIVRSAFGITHSLPFVADKVRLIVQVEAISPKSAESSKWAVRDARDGMRCKAQSTAMPIGIASICNAAARPYRVDSTDPISVIQWTRSPSPRSIAASFWRRASRHNPLSRAWL